MAKKEKVKKEKKGFGVSFLALLMLLGIVPMVITISVVAIVSINDITKELKNSEYEKLEVAAISLADTYEKELIGSGEIAYTTVVVDGLKAQNVELTLFKGDTRYITSLKDDSGKRNEGTQADEKISAKVLAGEDYKGENVKIGAHEYFVYYTPVYTTTGKVWGMAFAGTPEEDVNRIIKTVVTSIIVLAVILGVVCAALIALIAIRLRKPMAEMTDALGTLAGGNISTGYSIKSPITEVNQMIDSANLLQKNLLSAISGVKDTTGSLDGAVQEVDTLSEASSDGASQISTAVGELATTAQSLAESVQDVNANVITMGNNIVEIGETVHNLSEASENIKRANNEAAEYMNTVLESSNQSVSAVKSISEQIDSTNSAIEKINEAVALIISIAESTQLLALNATIEAARAGEAGRGFAVVAESIADLAQQSESGAATIETIANEITQMSAMSVKQAEDISNIIEKEQGYIKETQNKFNVLSKEVDDSIREIQYINDKTESLEELKNSITESVSDLSAISEENAASNQEVTANIESIASAISDTKDRSNAMAAMSVELRNLVEYFK